MIKLGSSITTFLLLEAYQTQKAEHNCDTLKQTENSTQKKRPYKLWEAF